MSKRTHNYGIEMINSGICLQSILYYLGIDHIMCHSTCNCSHDISLNECVEMYRQNGWYNLGNIINNVIRFGAERGLTPAQLRMVYGFLNGQLKMIYNDMGLAAQGLLINASWAKQYLIKGPKPEGAKAPRIEVLEVAVV